MIPIDYEAVSAELAAQDKLCRVYEDEYEYYGEAFRRILGSLPEDDRGLLEAYINVIESKAEHLRHLTATHYVVHGTEVFKRSI